MKVTKTKLSGVLIIEPSVFGDERGFFKEIFQKERYDEIGINNSFVQDNYSRSEYGVLKGLHFQKKKPQGKLVSCTLGSVFDVIVDIKPDSKTFSQYIGVEISEKNHLQIWVPPGYAHGFCVLSEIADFHYKCTDFYFPNDESGIIWNDPDINVEWPISDPKLSSKDLKLPSLKTLK